MRVGELCAGYNGLGMAVEEVFRATPAWFSEYDAAPSKILAHHYPDVPNYGDMTNIDWAAVEPVDIISGGTPCQDLSGAGRRAGMTEGTRSNLWVQMREAIAIQQPAYVVWENVRGAFSAKAASDLEQCPRCMGDAGSRGPDLRALGRVLGDLSDLGFDAEWRGVRASEVGACHARFRVFVLAKNTNSAARHQRRIAAPGQAQSGRAWPDAGGRGGASSAADGYHPGRREHGRTVSVQTEHSATEYAGADAGAEWGEFEPAIRRSERAFGRSAPRPTEPSGRAGAERLSPRFTEWMMGLPDGWVTDPAIGISRNEQLKACGNGVVPQQAVAALSDMLAAFNQKELAA